MRTGEWGTGANGGTQRAHGGLEGSGHTSDPFSGSAFLFFGILSGGGVAPQAIAGRQRGGICCPVMGCIYCLRISWKQPLGEGVWAVYIYSVEYILTPGSREAHLFSFGWGDRVACVLRRGDLVPFDAFIPPIRLVAPCRAIPLPAWFVSGFGERASVPRLGFGLGRIWVSRVSLPLSFYYSCVYLQYIVIVIVSCSHNRVDSREPEVCSPGGPTVPVVLP